MKHLKHTFVLLAAACLLALSGCGAAAPAATPETALPATPEQAMTQPATPEQAPETSPAPATPAPVVPDRIELATTEGILTTGHSWKIRATVLPEEAPDKSLTWTSDNEAVATVDADGPWPEGTVVTRPDGSKYVVGPGNVIFGYAENIDPNDPATSPIVGRCTFCGDPDHDIYHCPLLQEDVEVVKGVN